MTESRKIQLRAASAVELLTSLVVVHVWPRPSIEEAEERQSEQQAGKTRCTTSGLPYFAATSTQICVLVT